MKITLSGNHVDSSKAGWEFLDDLVEAIDKYGNANGFTFNEKMHLAETIQIAVFKWNTAREIKEEQEDSAVPKGEDT